MRHPATQRAPRRCETRETTTAVRLERGCSFHVALSCRLPGTSRNMSPPLRSARVLPKSREPRSRWGCLTIRPRPPAVGLSEVECRMRPSFRIPLRVAVPIVGLSGIVGVAAGVLLPVQKSQNVSTATRNATPPASSEAPPPDAASLPQPLDQAPEPASHQLSPPAPRDVLQLERPQTAATAREDGSVGAASVPRDDRSTPEAAVPRDDSAAGDRPETKQSASAPEADAPKSSAVEQRGRSGRGADRQTAGEKSRRLPRSAASAPTRRAASDNVQRRDRTAGGKDTKAARPEQSRPVLSQVPILGPVFGLFTR